MRFLVVLLLPIVIFSYEWAPPQIVGTGRYSRFALDCYNRLWCLFSYDSLYGSFYENSQWSEPVPIFSGPSISCLGGFDATRAKDGKLWVLVCEEGFPEYYNTLYYDGSIWSDTFIIAGFTYHHLAADSIGKVWVVFDEGEDYRIWCDVCEDTVWSGPYVVCSYPTHDQVMGSNITVDPKGIRWAGATALHYPIEQIFLCHSDSTGAWSDSLIMGPQVHSGWLADILSDNNNNIWISWVDGNEDSIYTAYLDTNLNWSPYYLITQASRGSCNLAVDNENKVWIVYDKENNFYYRVWNGFEWYPEDSIVFPPASSASNGAIFYDPIRDRIWISFKTGGNDIYTTWTNPSSGIEKHQTFEAKHFMPEIYPNPAKSIIRVRYPWSDKGRRLIQAIKIFDVSGKPIKEIEILHSAQNDKPSGSEVTVSLKGITPGIYFLRLGTTIRKFLVVK
ncbi:MAG: T9SS type A sorting domain-containing protein [candidate division WOR-3 bacterium]|nr:T9SS type A sorting domain-containing protein [candidate division WOR-3 bacterium]